MAKAYRFTQSRRVALHRAQLISARKRKGRGVSPKAKRVMKATGIAAAAGVAVAGTAVVARQRHVRSGSSLHGPVGPRTATPMINVVGVAVPGTRAGLRVHRYGKGEGFAVTYTSRNSKGDRTMVGYRHVPLPKGTSLFGKQMDKSPAEVTGWQPTTAAHPANIEQDLFNSIQTKNPLTPEGKSHRNGVRGSLSRQSRARASRANKKNNEKDALITRSVSGPRAGGSNLIFGNNIPEIEVMARTRVYRQGLVKRGIIPNSLHMDKVRAEFRKALI